MTSQFVIYGVYKGRKEAIDQAETRPEADYLASEYQMAFGNEWRITIKKEKGESINGQTS